MAARARRCDTILGGTSRSRSSGRLKERSCVSFSISCTTVSTLTAPASSLRVARFDRTGKSGSCASSPSVLISVSRASRMAGDSRAPTVA